MNKLSLALISSLFCVFTLSNLNAQTAANNNAAMKHEKNKEDRAQKAAAAHGAKLEKNPACQNIINECKQLGFIAGQHKEGNGLWRDCVGPVLEGKPTMQKGKAVTVSANANDIAACKKVSEKKHKGKKHEKNNSTAPAETK